MGGQDFAGQAHRTVVVHGAALASVPVLFLGLLGLSRRLGRSDLATAALVAFGFGGVAVMTAAVASGFVATGLMRQILDGDGGSPEAYHALLSYTGLVNQGFARVGVVAWAVAVMLWSGAILKSRRMPRGLGIAGAMVGAGILSAVLVGHLPLNVHGFGLVTFAQSGWQIWIGVLLCREGPVTSAPTAG
jgi:hypothetical protein